MQAHTNSVILFSLGQTKIKNEKIGAEIVEKKLIRVYITADHRYFDGSLAAKLLQCAQEILDKDLIFN